MHICGFISSVLVLCCHVPNLLSIGVNGSQLTIVDWQQQHHTWMGKYFLQWWRTSPLPHWPDKIMSFHIWIISLSQWLSRMVYNVFHWVGNYLGEPPIFNTSRDKVAFKLWIESWTSDDRPKAQTVLNHCLTIGWSNSLAESVLGLGPGGPGSIPSSGKSCLPYHLWWSSPRVNYLLYGAPGSKQKD